MDEADNWFKQMRDGLDSRTSITQLVSLRVTLPNKLQQFQTRIHRALEPQVVKPPQKPEQKNNRKVHKIYRTVLLDAGILNSEHEINSYVENLRTKLLNILKENDAIDLQ